MHHDDNLYSYADASDGYILVYIITNLIEDMEDLDTDDEESVVDGSPFP